MESWKMKVVWGDHKTLLNPSPKPKIANQDPKIKNGSKIKSKSNIRIEENIENESCSTI